MEQVKIISPEKRLSTILLFFIEEDAFKIKDNILENLRKDLNRMMNRDYLPCVISMVTKMFFVTNEKMFFNKIKNHYKNDLVLMAGQNYSFKQFMIDVKA